MSMSNGAQAQKLVVKPRKIAQEIRPDLPQGKWEALIPKGRCKAENSPKGDPRVVLMFKAVTADDPENATFQGTEVKQYLTFYDVSDPERRGASNMQLQFATGLAEACGLELSDVYPDEIRSADDLLSIIEKLEGKRFDMWTVHRENVMPNGDKRTNIDIRFKEPGSGLATSTVESDDEDRPGAKKPAKGKGRR
jgi:hypothetical protein